MITDCGFCGHVADGCEQMPAAASRCQQMSLEVTVAPVTYQARHLRDQLQAARQELGMRVVRLMEEVDRLRVLASSSSQVVDSTSHRGQNQT